MSSDADDEVLIKLYEVISHSLQRSKDQMSADKKIFIDFKIESVETLELEFAIEEAFDKKIEPMDLWKLPSYIASKGMVEGGVFSPSAHKLINERFPLFEKELIASMKIANDLYKNIRIKDIAAFLSRK